MTRLFTIDNVGDWKGYEEEVANELNSMFFKNDEMLLDNEYQLADGTIYDWDQICDEYQDLLTEVLVDKIDNHPIAPNHW
jgi:hypothetical protein